MSVFLLPVDLCTEIERIMNSFWWGCEGDRARGIRWKSWDRLCAPKRWGGMGFRKIREFNIALLGKQAWRLVNNPNSLVARIFKAKYFANSSFFEARLGNNPSFVWRIILSTQTTIKSCCKWRVGNVESINIWTDPWVPNSDTLSNLSIISTNSNLTKVSELIIPHSSSWNEPLITSLFGHAIITSILNIPLPDSSISDRLIWTEDDKGLYTVKSCYKTLLGNMDPTLIPTWTKFWCLKLPPKIKTFFWQLCSYSLPTHDLLKSKMVPVPDVCQICSLEEESTFHLFTRCPLARNCWDIIGGVDYLSCISLLNWLELLFSSKTDQDLCIIISIFWKIWDARNEKI